ncbi:hypothetical protein N0V83_003118 [Neocucurbitaria cava]|uniref:N-acetyltransferase domain-containing protein n=1 Tax=Neocucurbitaria cava TaxID=798079 RepID=A0A9W8YD33_9PLEO|nr:hypothetical protein N0V83_003118 [Neocucurbitaria cava]
MSQQQQEADFIKVPDPKTGPQTKPVDPKNRLAESAISIELCDVKDAEKIAEGMYACWPASAWQKLEPEHLRPPEFSTRVSRFAKRLVPSFAHPHMHWVKAVLTSTGQVIGIAGWVGPGHPLHNVFRRSATDFYGWQKTMNWSDEDIADMWAGVDLKAWEDTLAPDDEVRREVLGDEPHWFLAPLLTWPEFQGRGVAKRLLNWAIEKADQTDPITPLYLESSAMARPVYMHVGFVPLGKKNMIRRGPAVVRGWRLRGGGGKERRRRRIWSRED